MCRLFYSLNWNKLHLESSLGKQIKSWWHFGCRLILVISLVRLWTLKKKKKRCVLQGKSKCKDWGQDRTREMDVCVEIPMITVFHLLPRYSDLGYKSVLWPICLFSIAFVITWRKVFVYKDARRNNQQRLDVVNE